MEILITHAGLVRPDEAKDVLIRYGFTVDNLLSCACWTKDDNRCAQDDPNLGYVVIQIETSMPTEEIVKVANKVNKESLLIEDISDREYNSIYASDG